MTLFTGDSLLVSLPGREVAGLTLPGSLVEPDAVLATALSPELRSALEILLTHAHHLNLPTLCVARPEIFTHGASEAWLRDRISASPRHVCLSDGSTIKPLSDLPTHVFFYGLNAPDAVAALHRLCRRAPELMASLRGQVNSGLILGRSPDGVSPKPIYVPRTVPFAHPAAPLFPFYLNRDSAEDSAARIRQAGPVDPDDLTGFVRVLYLPLTDTALDDQAFAHALAEQILRAFFDPTTLYLLRLPCGSQASSALESGLSALLAAVRQSGVILPRVRSRNIVVSLHDLPEDHVALDRTPFEILLHHSFDFWRYTARFFQRAQQVTVVVEPESVATTGSVCFDLSAIYGTMATRRWVAAPA